MESKTIIFKILKLFDISNLEKDFFSNLILDKYLMSSLYLMSLLYLFFI